MTWKDIDSVARADALRHVTVLLERADRIASGEKAGRSNSAPEIQRASPSAPEAPAIDEPSMTAAPLQGAAVNQPTVPAPSSGAPSDQRVPQQGGGVTPPSSSVHKLSTSRRGRRERGMFT